MGMLFFCLFLGMICKYEGNHSLGGYGFLCRANFEKNKIHRDQNQKGNRYEYRQTIRI